MAAAELPLPSKCINTLSGHKVDGNYCMSGGSDQTIKLWNPHKGLHIKTYKGGHNQEISDIDMTKDNGRFGSVGGDKQVFVWDVTSGNVIRKLRGHDNRVNTIKFNKEESVLMSGSNDATIRIWDLLSYSKKEIQVIKGFKDSVTRILITQDQIIASSLDGFVRTFDIRMGQLTIDSIGESITGMDMSNDEKFLLLSSLKSKIFLFDRDTGEVITSYSGKHTVQNYASMVKFSKNNKTVITPSESHSIALYDLVNKENTMELHGHLRTVVGVDVHPLDNNKILSCSFDSKIKFWA